MTQYGKPLPTVTPDGDAYWKACRQGRFVLQRCTECGQHQFPPRILCSHCGSRAVEWTENSGAGKVYSFTVVYRPPAPAFMADVPYVLALIQLDAGPRMMSNLVGVAPDQVRCDMRVRPVFVRCTDEITLVKFTPA